MHTWTINGRFFSQPITGVQRYAGQIVEAMDKILASRPILASAADIEVLLPPGTDVSFALQRIKVRHVGHFKGHLWEQVDLARYARGGLLSLANTGPLLHRRHIVCIHDTNTRTCPESYSRGFRTLYRGLHPLLGRTARTIATVSQYSAGELLRFKIAPARKLIIAPNGHEHALAWRPLHTEATRQAAGPATIVVLGSVAPHKNIEMLLALAPQLASCGFKLAIAGLTDGSVFSRAGREPGLTGAHSNVHWLGRISDEALAALLQDSLCLAFPSLTEGFGLPPLEAMARGSAVVVTDRASLPEICRDAALYAAPNAPAQWLQHFLRLRDDHIFRASLIARGLTQASSYSWRATAEVYLAAMVA